MTKTSMEPVLQELLDQRTWIEGLCNSLVRDRSQALDLAQETMTSVLQQKGPIANLRAYVRKVAENHALQQLRKDLRRRRRERTAAEVAGERTAESAHEVSEAFEAQRAVAEAVHALAEPFRTTVLLHHFEGQSLAAIARRQSVPEGTVRWRLFKAHAHLRERLQGRYGRDWKLAILPLCTPGLGRTASAMALAIAAMLLTGFVWLAWPAESGVAVEAAVADAGASAGANPPVEPAADGVVARTPVVRPGGSDPVVDAPTAKAAAEDQRAVVRVRVLDASGQPLEGASFRFDRLAHEGFEMRSPLQALLLPDVKATRDGRAVLTLRTDDRLLGGMPASMRPARGEPWELAFRVSAKGHLPTERRAFVVDGDDTDLGDVRLAAASTLRGRVVAKDGSAIGGVRVGVVGPPLRWSGETDRHDAMDLEHAIATAETASFFSRGRYELTPAPRGPALVFAVADGYRSAGRFVDVVGAEQEVEDLVLEPELESERVPGLVIQVVDQHGAPVQGAIVYQRHETGMSSGSSGPDGMVRFLASGGETGDHTSPRTVVANDPTGRLQSAIQEGVLPTGDLVTMTLRPARSVEVVVRSPAQATGEIRVDWAAIEPVVAAQWLATDGDRVRFAPPPFAARLRVMRDRCVPFVSKPYPPDAWPERIEVTLVERTSLQGTVLAGGQPVDGAQVLALTRGKQVLRDGYRMGEWAATGRFHAVTDARGTFALVREQQEQVRCLVQKDGFAPAVTEPVTFDPGTSLELPPVELTKGGTVRGRLRNAAGAPVARAVIALHHPLFGPRTMLTARDGTFAFEHVAAGGYEVRPGERPTAGGWTESPLGDAAQQPFAVDAIVREGEVTEVEVVVDACRLAVNVSCAGVRSLAGWTVALRDTSDHREVVAGEPLPVGDDGALASAMHFAVSRAGGYEIVLRAPGGPFGDVVVIADVAIAVGDNQRAVTFALAPWKGTLPGLGAATRVQLVQRSEGLRVEAWGAVAAGTESVACAQAPVGAVEVVRGGEVVMRVDTRTVR